LTVVAVAATVLDVAATGAVCGGATFKLNEIGMVTPSPA
jgi:hypothetical protein